MLNFNSKADVLDIVESYEFVIKILDNSVDLRKNLRLLKNSNNGLLASFANDCKLEFLESALNSKNLNNKLISSKERKGLSLLLQYSQKCVNANIVYRFTKDKKTQMITLCKVDSNLDLDSAIAKVKEMQSVLNSKDFKDSYLSLKDYLTMKKNQNDLHIVEAFEMYLKSKDLRAETIANYKRMFNLHVLPYFENVKCNNVTEAFVRMWLDKLQKKIKYVDKIFILMKNIFRLLKEKKYIVRNVFLEIDYKISYKTHKYKKLESLNENDLKALLNVDFVNKKYKTHIKDTLLFKMVLFTLYTALRLKNVVMLEWKHIDFTKKILTLKGSEMKNKQDFVLPLNAGAIAILKEMQKAKISNYVFDRNLASHKIYISNVIKALKECKKALSGIEWKRGDRRQLFLQVAKKYNLDSKFANKYFYSKVKFENLESSFKTYKNTTKASQNAFKQVISEMVKRKLNINLHCIRKAFSTILNEKGLEHNIHKYIIDSCLAHSTTQGSEGSYNFATYELMKKKLMDFWAGYIDSLMVANDNKLQMVASDSYMLDSSKNVSVELDSTNLKELLESNESAESNDNDTLSF